MKVILRHFSIARTPQQNRVAERRNMTLIEAARTVLADSKTPTLSFIRPFGCPATILNTIDHLGKFDDPKSSHDDGSKPLSDDGKKVDEDPRKENKCNDQEKEDNVNSTKNVNTVSSTVNVAGINEYNELLFDLNLPALEDVSIFNFLSDDEDDGIVADMNNLDTTIQVSHVLTTRIHKDHALDQVIGDLQ
nr:hypothetical protein [Tanacetum cinerariifolium]